MTSRAAAAAAVGSYALSDSEDELYDELFDSDDEELGDDGNEKKPKKKKGTDIASILKGSLPEPSHATINTKHLHDLIHQGAVELCPDYQRDVVWPVSKMEGLIQSIFMNYYIPPIIFAKSVDEFGMPKYVCIDGKQRCSSIVEFMDGKIPFISPTTRERFWYSKRMVGTRPGRELPPQLRSRFEMFKLQVGEYLDLKDEQQRDIFQRVQLGVALSAAEKLQALAGPWTGWLNGLQKKYITEPGTLGEKLDYDTKRNKSYQALVALVMLAHDPTENIVPTASKMKTFLDRSDPPEDHFKDRIAMALGFFVNIATNHYEAAFGTVTKRLAPVEFWFISFLIYLRMGNLSLARLATHIGEMRRIVHATYPGHVQANTNVMALLREEIAKASKKRLPGEQPAAEEYELDENVDARDQRAMKRARMAVDHDPTYVDDGIERMPGGTELTTTTRARAAATAPKAPATQAQRDVKPLPRKSPMDGTSQSAQAQAQPRPAPVNTAASAQRASSATSTLPTPVTSWPPTHNQQPINPNPYQQQANAPVQQLIYGGVSPYDQPRPPQQQSQQPTYSAQAYQQPTNQVTWINGQPMTAEQFKQYNQQRQNDQLRAYQQQQQQEQAQQGQQGYGRR